MENHSDSNLSFLIQCVLTKKSDKEYQYIYRQFKQMDDLTPLLKLAQKHAVFPLLYKTLKKAPDINLENLQSHYYAISQFNISLSSELVHIMQLLDKEKINILTFKGPSLAQLAYEDITLRQFTDIDLLIQKKDRYKVIQIMLEAGYVSEINLNKNTFQSFVNSVNVLGFYKPETTIYIEIHWELFAKNYAITWDESLIWEKTTFLKIDQHTIQTLQREQLFLYLCIHGSKHLFERLSWVCDIDRMIRSQTNISWENILDNAIKLGVMRIVLLSLALSEELLKSPLPQHIKEKIKEDKKVIKIMKKIIKMYFTEDKKTYKNYCTFKLLYSMRENHKDKLRFIQYSLFSPKFDDFKYIQFPNHLTFLYTFIRPLRLLFKYLR